MEQLKVEGISKSFDGEPVLADISITLNKGELVSLLGISGGGKTTLFNIIAGLSRPDTGHVLLDGEEDEGHRYGDACVVAGESQALVQIAQHLTQGADGAPHKESPQHIPHQGRGTGVSLNKLIVFLFADVQG